MSHQRLLLLGALGVVALAGSCARVLGIEDADCDPTYAPDCALRGAGGSAPVAGVQMMPGSLLPSGGGGGGGAPSVATAGAGGGTAMVTAAGAGGLGGGSSSGGSPGVMASAAGAAGSVSMDADPVVLRASDLCLEYCDTIQGSCTGISQQYASMTACLLVCELLPPGTPGSTSGNNVECRLSRAELAATTGEGGNYCYMAGPGGGNVCGSDCDGYCSLMISKCSQFNNVNQCLTECLTVPNLSQGAVVQTYNVSMQAGDSVQCRLFHVSASTLDPVAHCPHAAGQMPCL